MPLPQAAIPAPALLAALSGLCADPANRVFIVSGRDQVFLDAVVGERCPHVGLSAEHGAYLKEPWRSEDWVDLSAHADRSWMPEVASILDEFTERTPGAFVEHKRSSLTWHYRLADPQHGAAVAQECYAALEAALRGRFLAEILIGKKNLEVRPRSSNKGVVIRRILELYANVDFVFCAGDDRTDEDMFRACVACVACAGCCDRAEHDR